ncbi:hypothetical protein CSQ94_20480 [Janthinobacterium sp. BJB312]|nr:hypothetical protein CSQ94_20480 [Janthinobacterium sp. BJB312]
MIEFVEGDIFDIPAEIRVNTVNCVGAMGAGVALAFKKRYPEMFKDYQIACKSGHVKPGRMHIWKSLEGAWIINFPTKRDWRDGSRYEDIDSGLDDLRLYLDSVGSVSVALPALGCGNGGLDWTRVSDMIRQKLDGVDAHVYVLAPSASRRAGKNLEFATDDERKSAEQLGYDLFQSEQFWGGRVSKPIYVMGVPETLSRKWIALLPSRNPSAREIHVLHAISMELARSEVDVGVALVYATKDSEDVAEIFALQGIETVLLLPFGILTRKTVGKKVVLGKSGALTIASTAAATEKWSPKLYAQSMANLRFNAGAILLSDPEPEWLVSKELAVWRDVPISYVKYETTSLSTRDVLDSFGAKPIGRRGENGSPNLDFLLMNFSGHTIVSVSLSTALKSTFSNVAEVQYEAEGENLALQDGEALSLRISDLSQEKIEFALKVILKMGVEEIVLRLPRGTSEENKVELLKFGFKSV